MQHPQKQLYIDIGLRISTLRHRHKLTQAQLAEQLDITVKHVSEVERGLTCLSLDKMIYLCDILETNMDFLVRGSTLTQNTEDIPDDIIEIFQSDDFSQKKLFLEYVRMFKKIHKK